MADRNGSISMGHREPAALLRNVLGLSYKPIAEH